MSSVADFQARAMARAMRMNHNTPEITMNNTPSPPENEGNGGSDNEAIENNASPTTDEVIPPVNTVRHGDLTADDVTRLIQRHNLPEGVALDVRDFQRVFSQAFFKLMN